MDTSMASDQLTTENTGSLRSGKLVGATHSAAERIHKAADTLREKSGTGSSVTNRIAGNAASAMDQAATYIDEFSTTRFRDDVSGLIVKRPLQSMAFGVLFGFIAARFLRR